MKNKSDILKLKQDSGIKFIYEIPESSNFEYIIVGDVETKVEDNVRYFSLEDWFTRMRAGSLLPYVCSTLTKQRKIKEYLNIYERPNLLAFRKFILSDSIPKKEVNQECGWALQIMSEFKVNRPNINQEIDHLKLFLKEIDPTFKYYCSKNESTKDNSVTRSTS